ncbi:MAG TPA: Rieske (2Fe-2S) protein [Chthoniobacteraceae bacterium]|jgi:Rieske Fe-S protein|nr:Rieske (2Fe-2S) protein [Chthoniobacteraceae bacterium]
MKPACCREGALSRREFLLLTASTLAVAGCESVPAGGSGHGAGHVVDAGPAGQVAEGAISSAHQGQGFFLTRQGGKVIALSSYCTHRRCELEPQADRTFHCPCHGSHFDPAGRVVHGPATCNLPVFPTSVDANGHVLVTVGA